MDRGATGFKKLGLGLGIFSIGLGAAELLASRRIARTLGAEGHDGVIKAFGVREVVAGIGLINAPANASGAWNRVAGDAMDIAALGAAAVHAPRNRAVWGALVFVVGATALDIFAARGLGRATGKTLPLAA